MRLKFVLPALLLTVTMLLSACSGAPVSTMQANTRNLAVTGTGTVYLTPDVAYIYIGVHTENEDISQAVSDNNDAAQSVKNALVDYGVAEKDIQTSNFSIWPNQQYDPATGEKTGTIYNVDNNVYVTVRDLENMGDILAASINAGANSINSIQFDVADKSAGQAEARQKAVDNASALAEELADITDVNLGEIQTISYSDNQGYPYYAYGMGGGGGGAEGIGTTSIAPGQLTLSVTVSITYEIK
jgi:uncharacterized protein YggE